MGKANRSNMSTVKQNSTVLRRLNSKVSTIAKEWYRLVVFEPSCLANKLFIRRIMFPWPVIPSSKIHNLHWPSYWQPVIVISLFRDSVLVTSHFITTDINYAIKNSENLEYYVLHTFGSCLSIACS